MVLLNDIDLINQPIDLDKRKKRMPKPLGLMEIRCKGCFSITTVFRDSQTVGICGNCQTVLDQPTGGRARLTEGPSFRRRGD